MSGLELDTQPIQVADTFDRASLLGLAEGSVSIIWHREFYPRVLCEDALPAIRRAAEASSYTLTSDLQSLGTSIGEAVESEANEARYFATSESTAQLIRKELFATQPSPIDLIRVTADELWPGGAMVGRRNGDLMLSGIIRRWTSGGKAKPHMDQRLIPLLAHFELEKRIGINVYVSVPPTGRGGEIEFWGRVTDESSYVENKDPDYGLQRTPLGEPLLTITPTQGDLIAFDAARLHSVAEVTDGERVTAACFLGIPAKESLPIRVFA